MALCGQIISSKLDSQKGRLLTMKVNDCEEKPTVYVNYSHWCRGEFCAEHGEQRAHPLNHDAE